MSSYSASSCMHSTVQESSLWNVRIYTAPFRSSTSLIENLGVGALEFYGHSYPDENYSNGVWHAFSLDNSWTRHCTYVSMYFFDVYMSFIRLKGTYLANVTLFLPSQFAPSLVISHCVFRCQTWDSLYIFDTPTEIIWTVPATLRIQTRD
jgi:hypothetical protein